MALVASLDGSVVGGAELTLRLDADVETMSVELGVLRDARGGGVGAALLCAVREVAYGEDRHVMQAEVFVWADLGADEWRGARFAERHGLRCDTWSTASCSTCGCETRGWKSWRQGQSRASRWMK